MTWTSEYGLFGTEMCSSVRPGIGTAIVLFEEGDAASV